MRNYSLYDKISKKYSRTNEKQENFSTILFYFAFFSKLGFCYTKTSFPLFLGDLKSDRAKNVFGDTSTDLGDLFLSISPTNRILQASQKF
jgi:hypothetical protein